MRGRVSFAPKEKLKIENVTPATKTPPHFYPIWGLIWGSEFPRDVFFESPRLRFRLTGKRPLSLCFFPLLLYFLQLVRVDSTNRGTMSVFKRNTNKEFNEKNGGFTNSSSPEGSQLEWTGAGELPSGAA